MKTKKELKDDYKQLKFPMGVFQIRNTVNGKIYIESSVNLDAIWNRHRTELNFGGHRNPILQKEWKEFGEENFRFEVLSELEQREGETTDPKKELKLLEQMYIEELQPFEAKGYHKPPTPK